VDFDSRIKALSRLAESETEEAGLALRKELERAIDAIGTETQYDHIEKSIAILRIVCHRFSREVLGTILTFIQSIADRKITYSDELAVYADRIAEYQNADTLRILAIGVLEELRYRETNLVLPALMDLSQNSVAGVRAKAEGALTALARYDITAFQHVGAAPQKAIVEMLESIPDHEMVRVSSAVLRLLDDVLSPTMERTAWSYQALTISRGATPAFPDVKEVRTRAIGLLKRLYRLAPTVDKKLSVVGAFSEASRSHDFGGEAKDVAGMVAENTVEVLRFYRDLVRTEPLQVLQKIESNSYWMFYHSSAQEVKAAAESVEESLKSHAEYGIYKNLIGFESIFLPWKEAAASERNFEDTDRARKQKADEYANGIDAGNFAIWRDRIVRFAQTESDDLATFPIFYYFLQAFAIAKPELAMRMVAERPQAIEKFLIPLLRGLWSGPQESNVKALIDEWSKKGVYLYQSMKIFLDNEKLDRTIAVGLLNRAIEVRDLQTVALAATVAVSNFEEDRSFLLSELFLPAVRALTKNSSASWVFDFWYRKQARKVISALNDEGVRIVLENLTSLRKLDYQAEEVLSHIAKSRPEIVLRFLCARFAEPREREARSFEAIPYELQKLHEPLARIPKAAVRIVRESYDGDFGMFVFKGGRLLKTIFRSFPREFERELVDLATSGASEDIEFVLAVLRNYKGQPFTHEVAKAVLRAVPADSKYQNEVAAALMTTGVVSGPYGFAEAYERKKGEMKDWLQDSNEKIRGFAKRYVLELDGLVEADRKRADEDIELRKHKYGE
jgi:hypothetical protein